MSAPSGPVWPSLRAAARVFCPPLEVVSEQPGRLTVQLQNPETGDELRLRYRSARTLFERTHFLVIEADIAGRGPTQAGKLVLRGRRLRWKRPVPPDGKPWARHLFSAELHSALGHLQVEKLALAWEPGRRTWRVSLETLYGSLTVTFFPPLMTPNPLKREEAAALVAALAAVKSAAARTPA